MKTYKTSVLVSMMLGIFSTTAFSATVPAGTPLSDTQVFRQNTHSDPGSLDPQLVQENTAAQIVIDLFEGLIWLDENGQVQPAQAEKWTVSDDGKIYTFSLRDAKWSDGTPVTAKDFVLGWQRAVDPKFGSPNANYLTKAHILNAEEVMQGKMPLNELGIKALNDKQVEVTLTQATPYFLQLLAYPTTFPVPHHKLAQFGDKWATAQNIVSNGAYQLKQWTINEKITAERNPLYWNDKNTLINTSEYLFQESLASAYQRYQAKELDLTWVPVEQIPHIQKHTPDALIVVPRLTTEFYTFNVAKPPFDNEKVRKALYFTLDRSLIAEHIIGLRKPAATLTPPEVDGFNAPNIAELNQPLTERIAQAKKLLNEAGYSEKKPLQFEIFYNKYATHEKVALALASEWKKQLGTDVKLRTMEWKTYLGERNVGNFQLSRMSIDAEYNEPSAFLNSLLSTSPENVGQWKNKKFDQVMKDAQSTLNDKTRADLYQQAEQLIAEQAPLIPIFYSPLIKVINPAVGGFPMHNPQDYVYTKELYIRK